MGDLRSLGFMKTDLIVALILFLLKAQGQVVAVEFIVSTPIKLSPSTTSNEIQNAVKEAISRNISSSLWYAPNIHLFLFVRPPVCVSVRPPVCVSVRLFVRPFVRAFCSFFSFVRFFRKSKLRNTFWFKV